MGVRSTLRPLILDIGCCGLSALQIAAPSHSLPGLDYSAYGLNPKQANVLVVAGRVSSRLVPLLRSIYEELAAPRWVVAYGVCAVSGAVFDTVPVSRTIPVDAFLMGCPPQTEALQEMLSLLSRQRRP